MMAMDQSNHKQEHFCARCRGGKLRLHVRTANTSCVKAYLKPGGGGSLFCKEGRRGKGGKEGEGGGFGWLGGCWLASSVGVDPFSPLGGGKFFPLNKPLPPPPPPRHRSEANNIRGGGG